MNPRLHWLWLFVIVNIIAALIMLDSGELIGDLEGIKVYSQSALWWATVLVVASYLIILGPVFNFISRLKIRSLNFGADESDLGKKIGILLAVLQILFIVFNLSAGVNIAGANNATTDSPFAMFWVLFPVDALFLIYYGTYRENKYFYPNLAIWILSNTLRGWAGIFLLVIFFEWCRAVYNKKVKMSRIVIVGLLVLAFYPLLSNLKWVIRAAAATGLSLEALVEGFASNLESADYLALMGNELVHLIGRLQTTSMMVDVMRLSDFLQAKFAAGEFAPFWKEGLHGIIFDRLFVGEKQSFIGVLFTKYEDFGYDYNVGDWNVSLGYPSWFFITPLLTPVYLLYTFFLGFISFYLVKKIGMSMLSKDMLWYSWLVYLMAPWFLTFTGFIYALFVFLVMKIMLARMPFIRMLPKRG
jgi:hypothetical protein